MAQCPRPTLLCILDGFGLNPRAEANAVQLANTPNFDSLWSSYPRSTLITCGLRVGLPEGQMGNSEVGHLNIGAGRVVEQWLVRISRELQEGSLPKCEGYKTIVQGSPTAIHLVGLCSDGGVHSHIDHLKLLITQLRKDTAAPIRVHVITDGRDVSPNQSEGLVGELDDFLKGFPDCAIATVSGRFYAMDRDKRWDRVQKAYDTIVSGQGASAPSAVNWISQSYKRGTTDEFIEPAVINYSGASENDAYIFWNFRADRMREIVSAIAIQDFGEIKRTLPAASPKRILLFTEYDATFKLPFVFEPIPVNNHLGEVVAASGLAQFRCAETEKYPHVTYFFNGGVEQAFPREERGLVPSPRDVKTYDQKPEMSADGVAEKVLEAIESDRYDFIVVNFANPDMVGHTGVLDAAIKAVETVDGCLGQLVRAVLGKGGQALIIADHGNCEQMVHYEDGSPHTAHTTYPVPVILVGDYAGIPALREDGALCDVAPTILKMMKIDQPAEMTGTPLF